MAIFKDHKVSLSSILESIPEGLLADLAANTKVDHYAKILHGRKLFYLLMYGILENEKLSQRSLEDTFNDSVFKTLFNLDPSETVRRSSISERLSRIEPDYFKQIYECVYERLSKGYSNAEKLKNNLIYVDSTMVSETTGKLSEGLDNKSGKKSVKYSVAFDGMLPCYFEVFASSSYNSEDKALPEVVMNHVHQESGHKNIYVMDRGLQSGNTMGSFSRAAITFVSRAKENRRHLELESLMSDNQDLDLGSLVLIKDSKVHLYVTKSKELDVPLRLVIAKSKTDDLKHYWFITNDFEMTAKEVADAYRSRWDIEVFFRFIKQELNVRHLVSLNRNGIEIMLYMTLIVAMLVLIYKHENSIGYKTAKRRIAMELRDLVIDMIIVQCGGDPAKRYIT